MVCPAYESKGRGFESRRAHQTKSPPFVGNVIQIRMTERELELKYVPVSFFC